MSVKFFLQFQIQQRQAKQPYDPEYIRWNKQPEALVAKAVDEELNGQCGRCGGEIAVFNIDGMLVPAYRLRKKDSATGFGNWCQNLNFKATRA